MQADSFMQGKGHFNSEEFSRLVSEEKYPKLNDCTSLLGSFICESSFSIVNRLDSQMLSACIRLVLTEIPVSDRSMGEGHKNIS